MFLNTKSLSLKLIDFGFAERWNQDLRKELKRVGKVNGSVISYLVRFTIPPLKLSQTITVRNATYGHWELSYMS